MATAIFMGEIRRFTDAVEQCPIDATNYRAAVAELQEKFPGLTDAVLEDFSVAIDGDLVHSPLLEHFSNDSELVFIPKIAGG